MHNYQAATNKAIRVRAATLRARSRVAQVGFTLLEFMLVLALTVPVSIYLLQQARQNALDSRARAAGLELKQVNDAVGAFLQNNYLTLIATPTATITIADLTGQSLLPSTFTGLNPWGFGYEIRARRTGVAGAYNIETLTLLNGAFRPDTVVVDESLIGVAMLEIGAQSGSTTSATTFTAFAGAFTETSTDYPNITTFGQLGVKNNFASSQFFQFVRRDGSLAMTGPNPLNMAGQSIVAAQDVAAQTVTIAAAGDINFGPRARRLTWLLPRIVEMETYDANDGSIIPKPTCDVGGQQQVYLTPINTAGTVWAGNGRPYVRTYVEEVGTTWVARVKGWDLVTSADGSGFASSIARTFCYYP